jgi:IS30 family transposase
MAQHLTIKERIKLEALLEAELSIQEISKQLGKHRSTIYRERRKLGSLTDQYNASLFQQQASKNMVRDQSWKSPSHTTIKIIEEKILNDQWSPEQISNWLRKNKQESPCHTWIYKHIRIDKEQGGELHNNLRRGNYTKGHKPYNGKIKNRISIEYRPEEINHRTRCGDYEIDLINFVAQIILNK